MTIHPRAATLPETQMLTNIPRLMTQYYSLSPDMQNPEMHVSFGTSGHRGISSQASFNEAHILAIAQACAENRKLANIGGPLYIGIDSHALSEAALISTLEVLCANGVDVVIQKGLGYTPTPVISHAILSHNAKRSATAADRADGIIITPSHNPPEFGGLKYNPPTGGPADTDTTKWIEKRANQLLMANNQEVKRCVLNATLKHPRITHHDYVSVYVSDLTRIIDMQAIANSKLKLGVNPLGGATLDYWKTIGEHYKLDLKITEDKIDPTFSFMTLDHDGKIRMDCSSPYAMASLIAMKDDFDLAFGNDPDGDRHGIVTNKGLLDPNHYLAIMVEYLYTSRKNWKNSLKVGKTLVSSALIDRVAKGIGREIYEVPVGFKWFVDGLFEKTLGFGGEESAGASFLDLDENLWSSDKDGIIPCLLAAEMTAKTKKDPSQRQQAQAEKYGVPYYARTQADADAKTREAIGKLSPKDIKISELAGEDIEQILSHAPGNDAAIGGLKLTTKNGWVAIRPSGTEDIYKIYAESFIDEKHLKEIQKQAQEIVKNVKV